MESGLMFRVHGPTFRVPGTSTTRANTGTFRAFRVYPACARVHVRGIRARARTPNKFPVYTRGYTRNTRNISMPARVVDVPGTRNVHGVPGTSTETQGMRP